MHDAQSLQTLRLTRPNAVNQRVGDRVVVSLDGHCSINRGPDIACTTSDISMTGAGLISLADPNVDDEVKLSLRQIGLVSGRVVRLLPAGFAIVFDTVLSTKMVRLVNWLRNGSSDGARTADEPEHERIVPLTKLARLTRADGSQVLARTIDVSRSGIAVDNPSGLVAGERVRVGTFPGAVMRTWTGGAAIEFDALLPVERFDLSISFV